MSLERRETREEETSRGDKCLLSRTSQSLKSPHSLRCIRSVETPRAAHAPCTGVRPHAATRTRGVSRVASTSELGRGPSQPSTKLKSFAPHRGPRFGLHRSWAAPTVRGRTPSHGRGCDALAAYPGADVGVLAGSRYVRAKLGVVPEMRSAPGTGRPTSAARVWIVPSWPQD